MSLQVPEQSLNTRALVSPRSVESPATRRRRETEAEEKLQAALLESNKKKSGGLSAYRDDPSKSSAENAKLRREHEGEMKLAQVILFSSSLLNSYSLQS